MKKRREITEKTRVSRVSALIGRKKFFKSKQFKNTVCYFAAYDSWAAKGQAGGCDSCYTDHYNAVIENKRKWKSNLLVGSRKRGDKIAEVCDGCFNEIEKQLGIKIKTR